MKNDKLIISFSAAAVLIFVIFSFYQLSGFKKKEIPEVIKHQSAAYFLLSGAASGSWFSECSIDDIKQSDPLNPWPLAVRITDIIESSGHVTASVNRRGIAVLSALPDNICYESEMFYQATSGIIAKDKNNLLFHLYSSTFFPAGELTEIPAPFAAFDFEEKKIIEANHDFPENLASFSPVELFLRGEKWYTVWKSEIEGRTAFKYYTHSTAAGSDAVEISEKTFLASQQFLSESNASAYLKESVRNIIDINNADNYLIELMVRDADAKVSINYLSGRIDGNAEKYEKICAAENNEGIYFISYRGKIYQADNEKNYLFEIDCALPENFIFTALLSYGGKLYASWEYQQFYLTGTSGFLIIDEKSIDKIIQ